jgi:AcrR family transcriptional regulator
MAVATKLFHERGYHATGIDDIGAAAGITGPAVYRHFKNKEEILERILIEDTERVKERADAVVAEAETPLDVLRGLVEIFVELTVENPALAHVALYERRTLPPESRAVMERAERLYFTEWVHALIQVRPDLSDAEARVMVQGATGIGFQGALYRSGLPAETLEPLLVDMMMTALLVDRSRAATPRRRAAS